MLQASEVKHVPAVSWALRRTCLRNRRSVKRTRWTNGPTCSGSVQSFVKSSQEVPPYVADNGNEILRMAVRGDLAGCQNRLRASGAHPELIELTLKCLNAAPSKRLKDASVVADQVTSHLESVARKLKQAEVRRKLTYVVAASLLLLVMGLGAGGIWLQAQETEHQAQQAEAANQVAVAERKRAEEQQESNEELQQVLYASQMQLASANLASGNVKDVSAILDSYVPQPGAVDRRGFEWHYLNGLLLRPTKVGHIDWHDIRVQDDRGRDNTVQFKQYAQSRLEAAVAVFKNREGCQRRPGTNSRGEPYY